MKTLKDNPEIDLMIIDSLDIEYRQVSVIATELQLDEDVVVNVLQDLIDKQRFAIDKQGTQYRIVEEEEYPELEDD